MALLNRKEKQNKESSSILKKEISIKQMLNKPIFAKKSKSYILEGKNYLSIDIGNRQIKAVEGKFDKNNFRIDKIGFVELEPEVYNGGEIKDEQKLVETLNKLLRENNFKTKDCIVSIESTGLITREMEIPVMEDEYIPDVIKYEISEYLPIDVDKYILQYNKLYSVSLDNQEKLKVVVYALPSDFADQIYKMFNQIGLKPVALDIQNDNAENLINKVNINDKNLTDGIIAFIDLGNTSINLSIVKNGKFEFNRLIRNDLSIFETVKDSIDDSDENIHALISKYKSFNLFSDDVQDTKLQETILSLADRWVQDIQKLFQYYTSRNTDNRINSIYLYGGGSEIKNIDYYIGTRLNIPTWTIYKIGNLSATSNLTTQGVMRYFNAISALVDIDRINFFNNFIQSKIDKKAEKKETLYSLIALALILVVVLGVFLYNFLSIRMLKTSIANYQTELSNPERIAKAKEVEEQTEILNTINRDKSFLNAVDYSLRTVDTASRTLFDTVRNSMSENLYFTNVSIDNAKISIDGNSSDKMSIGQFEYNIRQTGVFNNIYIDSISKQGENPPYYSFKMTLEYDVNVLNEIVQNTLENGDKTEETNE
ncbi:pilus assembly protein PilM [Criibacterium bergeronii]|uniref:SHS2 domain-containing protein n=1 Tax=Criibacterium bergeronii TaxID=1871336 RepID=A0A371IJN3_9FIRM|nr:pilus assembly protein PilM [Criibacterium bergeronii]RDY20663.1 hypothetical protein BBG48_008920 [Criibacterium bergeronii]